MNLKFNHGGDTIIIPTTNEQPSGKRLAIRHDDTIYYAPIVGTDNANASSVKLVFGGGTYALPAIASDTVLPAVVFYNPNNPAGSVSATVYGNYYDFGVIADANSSLGYDPTLANGTEYYTELKSIVAASNNSTIIGNGNTLNYITLSGGTANVLTGGLGANYYYFENGSAGIITDFGIAASINGYTATTAGGTESIYFATNTDDVTNETLIGYDRFDPCSYFHKPSRAYFPGNVTEFAFEYYDTASSKTWSLATYYVTYEYTDSEGNVQPRTVMLSNVVKKPTKSVSNTSADRPIWLTDDVAAKNMYIYGNGTKLTSTQIKNLSVPKSVSAYSDNIAYLDALYTNIKGGNS